jgi:acyl carrier protein
MSDVTRSVIRDVLAENARLPVDVTQIADDTDLFGAGMSSHATVNVMVGLEDAFGVMFPDDMLSMTVFESIDAIHAAIVQLRDGQVA